MILNLIRYSKLTNSEAKTKSFNGNYIDARVQVTPKHNSIFPYSILGMSLVRIFFVNRTND